MDKHHPKNFVDSFLKKWENNSDRIFQKLILLVIATLCVAIRLFSVAQYESIIHEFDPWFNFRVSKYMANHGINKLFSWFDKYAWWPYGRNVFRDTYYGLMVFSVCLYRILDFTRFPVDIREICVFMGPFISGFTAATIFLITCEVWNSSAGLFAATFMAIIPGYISRSVAGSYDYECIAIFVMNLTFYFWIKSFKTGSFSWSVLCALSFFCMKSVWGGYIFVPNLISVHVMFMLLTGTVNRKIYVSYSIYFVFGSIFVTWRSLKPMSYFHDSMHISSLGVFCLLQLYIVWTLLSEKFPGKKHKKMKITTILTLFISISVVFVYKYNKIIYVYAGRLLQIFGISHGIDIVNSISEHQRASYKSYLHDINIILFLVPISLAVFAAKPDREKTLLILYILFSGYFSFMMVRVMLVFAPVVCIFAGITVSMFLDITFRLRIAVKAKNIFIKMAANTFSLLVVLATFVFYSAFLRHCIETARYHYSQPSVILSYNGQNHNRVMIDDFREAFQWMRQNTPRDAKFLSWWDYGYQITGFSKRTVYVDNNTRDTKTLARAGMILASEEKRAWQELNAIDADYALVIFGGKIGYSSDDINKGYWIIKIASGYYDHVNEIRNFRPDGNGDPRLQQSLLFKMCYYRFDEVNNGGYDMSRRANLGHKVSLKYLEEAYTSRNWLVRIFRVKKPHEVVMV